MDNAQKYIPMTKKEKIFRWCNIAFDVAIMLAGVALAIYYRSIGDPNNRFFISLGMLGFGVLPFIYELISRAKLTNSVFLIFNIYLLVAGLLGGALNGYNTYFWLDRVVHFIMGYMMAMLGLFIICRTKHNTKMHYLMVALFCLAFSLFIEAIWEIGEWTADNLFNQTAQGAKIGEYGAPLVTDTMEDICCNTGGALLFVLHYLTSKWSKKNLLISSMEKEFSIRHKLFEKSSKIAEQNPQNISAQPDENSEIKTQPAGALPVENDDKNSETATATTQSQDGSAALQTADSPENAAQSGVNENDEK